MARELLSWQGVEPIRPARLIKCYRNRKLYDTVDCRYVNLDEVADIIENGAEVKVLEHRTSRDVTRATLIKIVLQRERKTSKLDELFLQALVRGGGGLALASAERDGGNRAEAIRSAAEQRLEDLVERGERASDRAKETLATTHAAVGELQRKLNERVGAAWGVVAELGKVNRELRHVCVRIEELDERLRSLRARPTQVPPVSEQARALAGRRC